MPRFAVRFSTLTGVTTIHSPDCRNARAGSTHVVAFVRAEDATECAKQVDLDGDLTARQLPYPAICPCAELRDEVRKTRDDAGPKELAKLLRIRGRKHRS